MEPGGVPRDRPLRRCAGVRSRGGARPHAAALRRGPQHHDRGDPGPVPGALRAGLDHLGPDHHPEPAAVVPGRPGHSVRGHAHLRGPDHHRLRGRGGARVVGSVQVDTRRCFHARRGRRPEPGLADRGPHQPDRRLRLDGRLHARRAGRDPSGARVGHEHRHPVRAGDLRLRRRHRRALEQPALHVPRSDDPRGRRVVGHRVRACQLSQLRHRDPADGAVDRRAALASAVQADRWTRGPAAAPQTGEPAVDARRWRPARRGHAAGRRVRHREQPVHPRAGLDHRARCAVPRAAVGLRGTGLVVPVHVHGAGCLGHEQGRRRRFGPRRAGGHRVVRRRRRDPRPPRDPAAPRCTWRWPRWPSPS